MPKKFTHCVSRQISQKILPLFSLKNGDILKFSRVYYPNSTNEGNCPRSLLNFFTFSKDGLGIYGSWGTFNHLICMLKSCFWGTVLSFYNLTSRICDDNNIMQHNDRRSINLLKVKIINWRKLLCSKEKALLIIWLLNKFSILIIFHFCIV